MNHGVDVVGSREDPNAPIRAARTLPVLLHSLSLLREQFEIIFANRKIKKVIEVGVESGQVSSIYTDLGADEVHCIDPYPSDKLRETLAENPKLHLVEGHSPAVLAELPVADLYVIDGDHNYAVVHGEVSWIIANAPDAVVVFNDVLWPCARRDMYYEPSPLTGEDKHESSPDGPTVWHDELTPAGVVGLGAFTWAVEAGGERNGVLTAIEDAVAAAGADEWYLEVVPAVYGFGILVRKTAPGAKKIMDGLKPYTHSKLIATLEANRISLYTRVLQMQYEAVAHANDADRLAETISAQRHEIERLRAELDRRGHEVHELRRTNEELRDPLSVEPPDLSAAAHNLKRAAGQVLRHARRG
ncbi:class I SAM-dependent methyltransferase [Kibdelosporangium philippinense]|uniref:Class I SAM-dependent methyltransferase n=1 Tax=Kibdelosporangium philippinense TaxID=211113 RepID=A0ABS8ZNS9_9PSEU|nr:class I SAM-dependent methyltransferase [Kibdelosporangium philippinense]MCE7008863.1 class I SAM-dependent methyltransferase [Kibdelosporangium philippinense]